MATYRGGRSHSGGFHGHQHGRMSRWSDKDDKSSLEAAAEAAAKVNAMLIAKGALKPSQLSQQQPNKQKATTTTAGNMTVAEVEINDVPIGCRNMLTRGSTQEEISKASGAGVSTRGRYLSPHERQHGTGDRPLYLCVQGPTKESVDIAVGRINEIIMNYKNKGTRFSPAHPPQQRPQLMGPNPVEVAPRLPPPPQFISQPSVIPHPQPQTVTVLQEKLYIGLEHAPPNFGVKEKIQGPESSYLHHIEVETGTKVTVRGKGSGFIDFTSPGRDYLEPMHVFLEHPNPVVLGQAKQLAENLIQTVQQDYAQFQQALAAMPTGHATLIAGLSHQTSIPGALMNPVPTMAPPPIPHQLPSPGGTTRIMVPSSLGGAVQQVPVATSMGLSMSAPSVLATQQPPPILVQTQTAPHQIIGPPQLGPDGTTLVTTIQPEVQVVAQPNLGSPWGPPQSSVQGQVFSSCSTLPAMSPLNVVSSSPTVSTTYTYHQPPREEPKRRFTEEKVEEKVPENLLGYEHGPTHLANLVVQGPPPNQHQGPQGQHQMPLQEAQVTVSQHPSYQPQVSEMYSSAQIVSSIPQPVYTTTLLSAPSDDRNSPYASYTATVPSGYNFDSSDKQLMPPPPIPASLKRASYEKPGGSERKRGKESPNAYIDEEDKQSLRGKYQYNQYSNAPQLYTHPEPDQYTEHRPDSDPGYQYQPVGEQYRYSPDQQPGTVTHLMPPPPPTLSAPGPPSVISSLPSHLYSQQPMYSVSSSQSPPNPYTQQQEVLSSSGQQYATVPQTITIAGPPPTPSPDHILQPPPEARMQHEDMPPPPQIEQIQPPPNYTNMPPPITSGQYLTSQSVPLPSVTYSPQQPQMSGPPNYPPPPPGMPYYITS